MDTIPIPTNFMAQWAKEVMREYPAFNIVIWRIDKIATTAYWQKGSINKDGYESGLLSVTDFPLFSIPKALNEPGGWETGMKIVQCIKLGFCLSNLRTISSFG
jgi:hypothetical protein